MLSGVGHTVSSGDLEKLFALADKNSNGTIDTDEFYIVMDGLEKQINAKISC